jgi:hypothetical protein
MAVQGKVSVAGASGTSYEFEVHQWGTDFKDVGAVYLILRNGSPGRYGLLYIGQTGDLSERFDNHHKRTCFDRNGKTHIGVKVVSAERQRLNIESDLLRKNRTTCND